jgi:hypothetical protein
MELNCKLHALAAYPSAPVHILYEIGRFAAEKKSHCPTGNRTKIPRLSYPQPSNYTAVARLI